MYTGEGNLERCIRTYQNDKLCKDFHVCLTVLGCIGVAFLQLPNADQTGVQCINEFCVSIVTHCIQLAMVDI